MNLLKISRLLLLTAAATVVLAPPTYAQVKAVKTKALSKRLMPGHNAAGHRLSHAMVVYSAPDSGAGPGQTNCSAGCYYTPANLITAYAIGSIAHGNGGSGMVVGIVDAYYNPQTAADLNTSIAQFNLAPCPLSPPTAPLSACLTIVTQTGCSIGAAGCTAPATNDGWAVETNLDVQIVHAIAPNAKILLVATNNNADSNLFTGVEYAAAHANVVTNSYGGDESSGETAFDSYFSTSTVPILFSSGDTGATTEYPCTSSYVLCVGGTSLLTTATSFRNVEGAWGNETWTGNEGSEGAGGGCSPYVSAPSFQSGYSTCGSGRGVPDVSALADPYTGFATYMGSNAAVGLGCTPTACPAGFYAIGGTSLASPLTAAVIANIDADRVFNSKSVLGSNLNALIYEAAASYRYRFYDVTVGSTYDGVSNTFNAGTGWDKATGLGVILGPSLATYLLTTP
jgi:subtilase family serine protease